MTTQQARDDQPGIRMIAGISEIADQFDGYLVDLWGCVHNGIEPYPAAVTALLELRKRGKSICMLSNGPRRAVDLIARLDQMGVPRDAYQHVMSSGEATWNALAVRPDAFHQSFGQRCDHIGPSRDISVTEGNGTLIAASIEDADFILCTGPVENHHPIDVYTPVLTKAAELGVPMVCANPDLVVHIGEDLVYCAGTMAALYQGMGGKVSYHGKPYQSVYDQCFSFFPEIPSDRLIGIGDGLRTDILGANRNGIKSLFLTGGIHSDEITYSSDGSSNLQTICRDIGAHPNFAAQRLEW